MNGLGEDGVKSIEGMIVNLGRLAKICAEAFSAGINPLPMLRRETGAKAEFGYYQGYQNDKTPPNWCPPKEVEVFIGVAFNEYSAEVTLEIFKEGASIGSASAQPDLFENVLAEVNDYERYKSEFSNNGGAYLDWYEFRYDGGPFSGEILGDVFSCTSCELVPDKYVRRMKLADFIKKYQPRTEWQNLIIAGCEIIPAKYHRVGTDEDE